MDFKKINFKEKRYIYPLIFLPFILFGGYQVVGFLKQDEDKVVQKELSTDLGNSNDSILSKDKAYDEFFGSKDNRSMITGLDEDRDSLNYYTDNLTDAQKRRIDSINYVRDRNKNRADNWSNKNYYEPPINQNNNRNSSQKDYDRSAEIIRMLNNEASGANNSAQNNNSLSQNNEQNYEDDPVKLMKKQMLMMDSLEKSKDPEYLSQMLAQERLKKNKEKMARFLNSTLRVNKLSINPAFNHISREKKNIFIKAVIDENVKGYLGSRIRIRLLEDIYAGKNPITKGSVLYAQISGFDTQRVKLNIVSIISNGEILPVNLSIYDVDGMEGLYVPASTFREMLRELGTSSIQGTQLSENSERFFTSLLSKAFSSTSQTIANLLRKNKAKLKYNSYIYLIDNKELKKNEY